MIICTPSIHCDTQVNSHNDYIEDHNSGTRDYSQHHSGSQPAEPSSLISIRLTISFLSTSSISLGFKSLNLLVCVSTIVDHCLSFLASLGSMNTRSSGFVCKISVVTAQPVTLLSNPGSRSFRAQS